MAECFKFVCEYPLTQSDVRNPDKVRVMCVVSIFIYTLSVCGLWLDCVVFVSHCVLCSFLCDSLCIWVHTGLCVSVCAIASIHTGATHHSNHAHT